MQLVVFLLTLCFASPSLAQQQQQQEADTVRKVYRMPSITVTTLRAEKRRDPVPIETIRRVELQQRYTVQDFPLLLSEAPSILAYSQNGNGIGYSFFSLRGFDQRRVAVFINGVPQNDPEDHNVYWIDLPDLAASTSEVQIQRGAGLVDYGAAAIGGSIHISTLDISQIRGVHLKYGLGLQQYFSPFAQKDVLAQNVQKYSIEVGSGLVNNFAVYARLSQILSKGYRRHSWANLKSYFLSAAHFSERFSTQINIFGGPLEDGLAYTGIPKYFLKDRIKRRENYSYWEGDSPETFFGILRRPQEIENFSQPHYEILNDWQITDNLSLKSILFYYTGDGFFDFDGSWADAQMLRITPENGFPPNVTISNAIIRAFVGNKHGGWIPRLQWRHQNGQLTAGAEIRIHRSEHWGKVRYADGLPKGYDPDYKFYSYNAGKDVFSIFARERYQLTTSTLLSGDIQFAYKAYRLFNEKAGKQYTRYFTVDGDTISGAGTIFFIPYFFVNGRLGIRHQINPSLDLFASVAITQREPQRQSLYNAAGSYYGERPLFQSDTSGGRTRYDFSKPLVKPEKLLDIELGAYYQGTRLQLEATAYWMEFFDELVKQGQLDIFGRPIYGNAPRTRHIGIELHGSWTIPLSAGQSLQLKGNLSLSRNRLVDYTHYEKDTAMVLDGNPIAGFPDLLGNLRLTYQDRQWWISARIQYVGAFYTDNFKREDRKNDPYTLVHLEGTYQFDLAPLQYLRLRLAINNLLNTLYSSFGEGAEFFPGAERNLYFGIEIGW